MKMSLVTKYAWLIVLSFALSMSAWSLYYVLRYAGMPVYYAVGAFVVFDGSALLCGDYSLKFARIGESGIGARIATFMFAGASAYINSMHATIAREDTFYHLVWALPPIVVVTVYEIHTRWERRHALARSKKKLPSLGILTWVLHPVSSSRSIRRATRYQAQRTLAVWARSAYFRAGETSNDGVSEFTDGVPEFPETVPEFPGIVSGFGDETRRSISFDMADARVWARENDYMVKDRGPVPEYVLSAYRDYLETIAVNDETKGEVS